MFNEGYDKLVNPVEVFKAANPEAFEFMPGGARDLLPEVELMAAMSREAGRAYQFNPDPSKALMPEDICLRALGEDTLAV